MLRITGSSKLGFFLFVWNYEKIHIMGIFYIFQKSFLGGLEYEVQEAIKGYILVHTVIFLFLWFFLLITNQHLSLHCTYIKLDLFSFLARKFSFLFPDWMCLVDISKKGSFWGPSDKEMLLERVNKTTKVQRLMQILRVKGTVSWDFRQFVCLKDSAWAGPHMNGK